MKDLCKEAWILHSLENVNFSSVSHLSNACSLPARLSQDLAKDLAILAREIHDVAGDGDPQNPRVESSASVSTVTAQEQVHKRVYHIPGAVV